MLGTTKKDGRIFISYRRSDAKGYAGRLADALEEYFGNNRVFRDIEDIKGGAAFGEVIKENIQDADAVIVLMGPEWLTVAGSDGTPRLFAAGDWVAQEIQSAIELGIPIFPVLIEDTPMPREEELPEQLHSILEYNASHVSDKNWDFDVLRLAKVLSFDIPSVNERKVNFAKTGSSLFLFLTLAFTTCVLFWNFFSFLNNPYDQDASYQYWKEGKSYQNELVDKLLYLSEEGNYRVFKEKENAFEPIDKSEIEALKSRQKVVITQQEIDTLESNNIVVLSEERFESIKGQDIVVLSGDRFAATSDQNVVVISNDSYHTDQPNSNFVALTKKGLFDTPIGDDPTRESDNTLTINSSRDIVLLSPEKYESLNNKKAFKDITPQKFQLLDHWATVPPYIGIFTSLLLVFYIIPLIAKERQKYLFATIYAGAFGVFIIIMGVLPIRNEYETMWLYLGGVTVITVMFSLMNMSGFKVK